MILIQTFHSFPLNFRVKYGDEMHMTNLEEKFAAPINCHIAHVVDDTSHVLKSSPNPTLSQLQTANQIELDDATSVIKSEDTTTFAMPYSMQ